MEALLITALTLGLFHAFVGPDHYVPFVALAKARGWSFFKTMWITFICGIGHVLSSVVIGVIGISIGASLGLLEDIEATRGDFVKYALFAFGLAYFVYGLKKIYRSRKHTHSHSHGGEIHVHEHSHIEEHTHSHDLEKATTFWAIFLIFVFGPCEVLIPLVMVPAAEFNWMGVISVSLVFSLATLSMMLFMVTVLTFGLDALRLDAKFFRRWGYVFSGTAIMACAFLMFLGL